MEVTTTMIQINSITKQFEKERVLDNVQMEIQKGSTYGLLGSNGAGKTTLLKIVAGIIQQGSGEIAIEKKPVFENLSLKQRMIFIPNALCFISQYTVLPFFRLDQNIYSNCNGALFHQMKVLRDLVVNGKIHRCSKGMQRQVAFWLALCAMPVYL